MDDNSNSSDLKQTSRCEDSDQRSEHSGRNERKKSVSRIDVPTTGTIIRKSAGGSEEDDSNNLKKAGAQNLIKCEICSCEMSSDLVLSSHINGSRHKKRMKALEIVANLKAVGEEGIGLQSDGGPKSYRCEICSLTVNSPQQLEVHLAGSKHKYRMARDQSFNIVANVLTIKSRDETVSHNDCPPAKKRKKDEKVLFCDTCKITLNSKLQYEQHVLSKKHKGRTNGDRKKRLNRLESQNIPNIIQNTSAGNRFHGSIEGDRSSSQLDAANQQFPSNNRKRIRQIHSQANNRRNIDFN